MVGVLTSGRCDNCRKRKKKCGEEVPSCSNCIRAGWICPGYKKQWKFMDENRGLRSYYAKRKYVYEDVPNPASSRSISRVEREKVPFQYFVIRDARLPRPLASDALAAALVFCMGRNTNSVLVPLMTLGSYFNYIPARLGLNPALDDAVSCLCAVYDTPVATAEKDCSSTLRSYARALSSLRKFIDSPQLQLEPLTLCATILLQICELAINNGNGEWSQLARGSADLIRVRGPERYQSPFERSMLESQLGYIFAQSMSLKQHCFLARPEWQRLLHRPPEPQQHPSLHLRTQLCSILVRFPTLMLSTLIHHHASSRELLISQATKLQSEIQHLLLSQEVTSQLYPRGSDIVYDDILLAVLDCVANSALLAIENLLALLRRAVLLVEVDGLGNLGIGDGGDDVDVAGLRDQRRRRVKAAFSFVRGKSKLAAKPLEFGLQQAGVVEI